MKWFLIFWSLQNGQVVGTPITAHETELECNQQIKLIEALGQKKETDFSCLELAEDAEDAEENND